MNGLGTRLRSSDQLHLDRYDLYETALLAGGPARVADTAVVALVEAARLRVLPNGRLVVVALRRRHPVEAAALDAVGQRGWRDIGSVRWRLETDPRLAGLVERLQHDGLVRPRRLPLPRRWWPAVRRTRAGRRLLRELRRRSPAEQGAGGSNASAVALYGAAGMAHRGLREDIFGPLSPPRARAGPSGQRRTAGSPNAPSSTGWYAAGAGSDLWYGPR
jgi:hypothetical protein